MGKAKKDHNKKVQNRNARLKNTQKHVQRVRGKIIQQMIKEHEEKKAAETIIEQEPKVEGTTE